MEISEILAVIYLVAIMILFLSACVFGAFYSHKIDKLRESYVNKLDEHEKSIILTYKHMRPRVQDVFKKD